MYAVVAIKGLPMSIDSLYTYLIPEQLKDSVKPGLLCIVPFGSKKEAEGMIMAVSDSTDCPEDKLKPLLRIGDDEPDMLSLSPDRLSLAIYIRERYFCTYWDAISLVLPFGKIVSRKVNRKREFKDPLSKLERHPVSETVLSPEQQKAYDEMKNGLTSGGVHLLFGVTGSGKTLVYIKLINDVLASGKTAVLLVPEIALTYQIVSRLYDHYGDDLAVLHSALTKAERKDTFSHIHKQNKKALKPLDFKAFLTV